MTTPLDLGTQITGRVLRGAASNYAGRLVGLVGWFFFTPFVLNHLGPAEYGLWVLVGSVVAYGWLFNLGISGAVVKYVAEYRSRGDTEHAHQLIAATLTLYTLLGLVCIGLSAVLAPLVPHVFQLPPEQQAQASWVMLLMGTEVGVAIPCTTGTGVLQGLQRYDLVNLATTFGTVATIVAMGIVLLLGGGVVGMVAVTIPITLSTQLLSVWFIHRIAPELRFGWRGGNRTLVRTIVSFSAPIFVMQIADMLNRKTDEIVVAAFLPISFVTPYSLARRLADLTRRLTDQFVQVLLPLASELHTGHESDQLQHLYTSGTRLTLAIVLPMTCTLVVLGRSILTVWVGPVYGDYDYLVTTLAIAALAVTSEGPAAAVLKGMARHRPLAISAICSGLANLGLSIVLIHPFGLEGVALGTLGPTLAESLGFVLPYTLWVVRVPLSLFAREVVVPAFLPAALMLATLYAGRSLVRPDSLLALAALIALGCGAFLAAYLSLSATAVERQLWRSLASGTLRLASPLLKR